MYRFRNFAKNWLLPVWAVKRTARLSRETTWMSMGFTPKVIWMFTDVWVIRTWRWNAERIARKFTHQTGTIYIYEVTDLP